MKKGKIFSITQAFSTIIGMAMSFASTQVSGEPRLLYDSDLISQLYNYSLSTNFLGAAYCLTACYEFLNLVSMAGIYYYVWRNERRHGPLGERKYST